MRVEEAGRPECPAKQTPEELERASRVGKGTEEAEAAVQKSIDEVHRRKHTGTSDPVYRQHTYEHMFRHTHKRHTQTHAHTGIHARELE